MNCSSHHIEKNGPILIVIVFTGLLHGQKREIPLILLLYGLFPLITIPTFLPKFQVIPLLRMLCIKLNFGRIVCCIVVVHFSFLNSVNINNTRLLFINRIQILYKIPHTICNVRKIIFSTLFWQVCTLLIRMSFKCVN